MTETLSDARPTAETADLLATLAQVKAASRQLALAPRAVRDQALTAAALALIADTPALLTANAQDLAAGAAAGLSAALLDRLRLTPERIAQMAAGLRQVADLPDPVGQTRAAWQRPNGLAIARVTVPLGVVLVIYESRPNVTADAAALCFKAGSACVLRGGSEALHSNRAIAAVLRRAVAAVGLPEDVITFIDNPDRGLVRTLLTQDRFIDLVVPRGGEGLIRTVTTLSTIPVVKHDKGVCHVFVDRAADPAMAEAIVVNAKVQRPGTCNAMETLLVDEAIAATLLPRLVLALQGAGVEVRGCPRTRAVAAGVVLAEPADWDAEYLDLVVAVRVVADLGAAIEHIARHGSGHSEAIVTGDPAHADRFLAEVDAAVVYVNASTRFTDGFEFGMGAEIGISTNKLHARGPMGLEELVTYKYQVRGSGQVRS